MQKAKFKPVACAPGRMSYAHTKRQNFIHTSNSRADPSPPPPRGESATIKQPGRIAPRPRLAPKSVRYSYSSSPQFQPHGNRPPRSFSGYRCCFGSVNRGVPPVGVSQSVGRTRFRFRSAQMRLRLRSGGAMEVGPKLAIVNQKKTHLLAYTTPNTQIYRKNTTPSQAPGLLVASFYSGITVTKGSAAKSDCWC